MPLPFESSIAEAVDRFDYRDNPATRRATSVPSPTPLQCSLWSRGQTGTAGANITERGAKATRPVQYAW